MKDLNQDGERLAETARLISGNCTLGEARICIANGHDNVCKRCGWRATEIRRRAQLPMHRNEKGLWQKRVGTK